MYIAALLVICLITATYFRVRQIHRNNTFVTAIKHNDIAKARDLVEHGAQWQSVLVALHNSHNVSYKSKMASSALHVALEYYYDASIDGNTALPEDVALMQNLLHEGAKATTYDLYLAASQNKRATVRLLFRHGANVKVSSPNTPNPLMQVALSGDTEMVEAFLKKGANINAKDELGWTPLMNAMWNEQTETVKFLLKHHADTDCLHKRNKYGEPFLKNIMGRQPKSPELMQILKMLHQADVTN